MLRKVFPEAFPADTLIAGLPVRTAEPAAFVAEKLNFLFLCYGQSIQHVKYLVQSEIGHHKAKLGAIQFGLQQLKLCQYFSRRGDKIEPGIGLQKVIQQQV